MAQIKRLIGLAEQLCASEAAVIIQAIRDQRAWARDQGVQQVLHELQRKVKGTEWEEILYPKSRAEFVECDPRETSMLETLQMIKSGNIPNDELWAYRMRIKTAHENLKRLPLEDVKGRLALLKEIHMVHDEIYNNKGDMNGSEVR